MEIILALLVISITLSVFFNGLSSSLKKSVLILDQSRMIWFAESILEQLKFSSYEDIDQCKYKKKDVEKKTICHYLNGDFNKERSKESNTTNSKKNLFDEEIEFKASAYFIDINQKKNYFIF